MSEHSSLSLECFLFKCTTSSKETPNSNPPGPALQHAGALGCAAAPPWEETRVLLPKGELKWFLMLEYLEAGREEGRSFPMICGLFLGCPLLPGLGQFDDFCCKLEEQETYVKEETCIPLA